MDLSLEERRATCSRARMRGSLHAARAAITGGAIALVVVACSTSYGEATKDKEKEKQKPTPTQPGDGGSVQPSPDAAPVRPSPAVYAQAVCNHDQRCFPIYLRRYFNGLNDCATKVSTEWARVLAAPGNVTTAAQLDACSAKLGTLCSDEFAGIPECNFRGTLPDGASCMYGSQCASGDCFQVASTADCGVCTQQAPEGASCANAYCQPGLICTDPSTCVRPVGEGGACDDTKPCATGLLCTSGKCAKPLLLGAGCQVDADKCDWDKGETCVPTTVGGKNGKCTTDAFGKLGQTCGWDAKGAYTECEAASCSNPNNTGTCAEFLGVGMPCSADGTECMYGLACSAGRCKARDASTCK